MVPQH
jgi:hypothetical protein